MEEQTLNTAEISFDSMCDFFLEAGSFASPSELHGQLCGFIASGNELNNNDFIKLALIQMNSTKPVNDSAKNYLLKLMHVTKSALNSQTFSFELLLPDDIEPMEIRLQSLSEWCHGFLIGFAFAGHKEDDLPDNLRSALADISSIASVDSNVSESENMNGVESDYSEVCEYVKIVVLFFIESNLQKKQSDNDSYEKKPYNLH